MSTEERIAKLEEKVEHLEQVLLRSLHRMMRREVNEPEILYLREQSNDLFHPLRGGRDIS